ncbi:MAG: hypothetical protein U5R30_00845 [Deltaproteobacteria bacterium]|nr:hypothetical protein [Deltaproteobacteria bacterium]
MRDYHRAGECARKALDLGYTAADRILAKIKSKSGAEAESEIAAEKSVSSDWLKTETLQDLSFPAAASVAEEPVDPAAAKQLFADGMAAYQKQAYRPACESFRRFVALMPAEPQGHYNLSILHYRLKEYEAALDCARRAQDLGYKFQKIKSRIGSFLKSTSSMSQQRCLCAPGVLRRPNEVSGSRQQWFIRGT